MKGEYKIYITYLFVLLLMLIGGMTCSGQTILTDKTFKKSKNGISLVEFWAAWNKDNECKWIKDVTSANIYRIDLDTETAKNYEITVLPTLIVFENGKEINRLEGDISFKLCPKRTPKKVQKIIDNLLINKF